MKPEADTLVILSPAFPADEADSVWIPAKQLFVKTVRQLYPALKVIVLAFNYPHHTDTYLWHGAQVTSFNGMHKRKWQRVLLWFKVWRQLQRLKKAHTIIGLFSFWCGECALVGHYFGKRHRLPHFCWIAGQDAKKENWLVRLIQPAPGELVTISKFLADTFYANHSIRPQYTIPIGIDPSQFSDITRERDIDVLGAGSLIPLKQYHIFIHVIKLLKQQLPDIKAVICGGGTEYNRLQSLIEELQLQNNVTLTGTKSQPEVLQLMQRSRIFLHTSCYEGFGAVCLEALYAGNQVISFTDPMYLNISKWHIVQTETAMFRKALTLLQDTNPDYKPILLYSMDNSVKAIMQLFGYKRQEG